MVLSLIIKQLSGLFDYTALCRDRVVLVASFLTFQLQDHRTNLAGGEAEDFEVYKLLLIL